LDFHSVTAVRPQAQQLKARISFLEGIAGRLELQVAIDPLLSEAYLYAAADLRDRAQALRRVLERP
jgi:hypothetical protein